MDLRAIYCALALLAAPALPPGSKARTAELEGEIRSLLRGAGLSPGEASVTILSPAGGRLVAIDSDIPLKPASNMKILTSLAALDLLGPDYRFETLIVGTAPIRGGVLGGDVLIRGTGDPNISGRFYGGDPLSLLRTWARGLGQRGLTTVRGDLVVDDEGYFDDVRFLPTWKRIHQGRWFSAEISFLNLNDNCIDIRITPGRPGAPARVEVTPASDFVRVSGAPTTVARGETKIAIHRKTGTNLVTISGRINARRDEWRDHVAVHDPALFFAHALARVFREEGIAVAGRIRRRERPAGGGEVGPGRAKGPRVRAGETLLVEHRSGLRRDLPVINKRSQNLHAEILLKTLGARTEGEGSVAGGGRAIRRFLATNGIPSAGLVVADGSGLSHENRASTAMLARVLHAASRKSYFESFLDSLPVAGRDGTLEKRFRRSPELVGRVFGKTGYISGVSALSGYLKTGAALHPFSMLFRRLPGGNASIKRLQERILAAADRRTSSR